MNRLRLVTTLLSIFIIVGLLGSGCAAPATPEPATEEATTVAATEEPATEEVATEEATEEVAAEEATAETPEVYRIGVSFPLTGDLASYGDSASKAAIMAQEQINAAGGINGVPIEVVIEDDRCDGEGGLTVLNKLHAEGIPIVTGFFCSSEVLNVCQRYNELGVVQYVHGSNPHIWDGTCGEFTFGTWGNDRDQGIEQARFVLEDLGATEVGMVYTNNDYGLGLRDAFTEAFEAAGGTIIIDLGVQQEGTDFRTEVARLKDAAPEVTLFEMYGPTGSVFLRQALELGVETQFVGDVNWASVETLNLEPTGAEGILAPTETPDSEEYFQFLEDFRERWDMEPFYGSNHQYDQIFLATKVIEMGGYTAEGIRAATMDAASDFVGASGPKEMGPDRNAEYFFTWVQFVDGEIVPYEP